MKTLADLGTPWAECYRGSGRPTGRLAAEPIYCQNGDVAPGWQHVGGMTETGFDKWFSQEQHKQCHSPGRVDYTCLGCQAAGWVK